MSNFTHTVLITGGTNGIGYQAALVTAKRHPEYKIVVASRTDPNFAAKTINATLNQSNVTYLPLDLSSLAKVREFAEIWKFAGHPPIKALALNAGLQVHGPINYTSDGYEKTFGVNHLGHSLLFHLLQPCLVPGARVVITSSGTHDPETKTGMPPPEYSSAEGLAHPTGAVVKWNGFKRYSTSKLVNMLWTYALARRFEQSSSTPKKTVIAFCPGLVPGTGLARDAGRILIFINTVILPKLVPFLRWAFRQRANTVEDSGGALAELIVGEQYQNRSGEYFVSDRGIKIEKSSKDSYSVEKQEDLWNWTVQELGRDVEERKLFSNVG